MFSITDYNKIILSEGDTATFSVTLVDDDGKERIPTNRESCTLYIYAGEVKEQLAAQIINNKFTFIIENSTLEAGLYVYKIVFINESGSQYTVVNPSIFEIVGGE